MSFRLALAWAGVDPNDHMRQEAIIKADNKRFDDGGESAQERVCRKMMEDRDEDYGEIRRRVPEFD